MIRPTSLPAFLLLVLILCVAIAGPVPVRAQASAPAQVRIPSPGKAKVPAPTPASTSPPALAPAPISLTVSNWLPATHVLSHALTEWCEQIALATSERVVCNLLPKPVSPPPGTFDAVREGLADVSYSVHAYTPGRYVLTQLAELPFSGESAEANSVAFQRVFTRHFARLNEHRGLKVIAVFTHGPGQLYTRRKPVAALEDFHGLKLRGDGGIVASVGKAVEANVVLEPSAAVPDMLTADTLDGLFGPAETVWSLRLEKLVRYRTVFPGGLYNTSFAFVMNQATWDRIDPADQVIIGRLSGEHAARMFGRAWDDADRRALAIMQVNEIQATVADPAFLRAVRTRLAPIEAKWIADARARGLDQPERVLREFHRELARAQ